MKTFTDEEIRSLAKDKKISSSDYMKLLLTAKQAVEKAVVPGQAECDILAGIRDVLATIAGKIEPAKDPLPMPAAQVNVSLPARGNWTATVTERDKNGYIKRVSFTEEV